MRELTLEEVGKLPDDQVFGSMALEQLDLLLAEYLLVFDRQALLTNKLVDGEDEWQRERLFPYIGAIPIAFIYEQLRRRLTQLELRS